MTKLQTFIKERDTKMLEEFDSFLHENYPKELWGIVSFAMITDFLKSFRAKERQDLLALIAEEVGKKRKKLLSVEEWKIATPLDLSIDRRNVGRNECCDDIESFLRSSLQVKE